MLDLIGFWGTVTVLTALFLAPIIFWVVPPLIQHFVKAVTDDRHKARVMRERVVNWEYHNVKLFGYFLWEGFVIIISGTGTFMWVMVGMATILPCKENDKSPPFESYVDFIAQASYVFAPYVGEISLFVIIYSVGIFLAKKGYKTYTKLEHIISKVNNETPE